MDGMIIILKRKSGPGSHWGPAGAQLGSASRWVPCHWGFRIQRVAEISVSLGILTGAGDSGSQGLLGSRDVSFLITSYNTN